MFTLEQCPHGFHHPRPFTDYMHSCDGCWCEGERDCRDYGWPHDTDPKRRGGRMSDKLSDQEWNAVFDALYRAEDEWDADLDHDGEPDEWDAEVERRRDLMVSGRLKLNRVRDKLFNIEQEGRE